VADAELPWDSPQPFDYIHGRALLTCFKSPLTMIQEAYDNLAPGGYLELQDAILPFSFASPPPPNSAFERWNNLNIEGSIVGGRPWNNVQHYGRWLREAGFEVIRDDKLFTPTGTWGPDFSAGDVKVGQWMVLNVLSAMEGWTVRNLERIGWSAEKAGALVRDVKEEIMRGDVHAFNYVVCVVGRKPL